MTSPLTMTRAAREAFLADLHVGVFAVAAETGHSPLAVPVWYGYEPGGDVVISTGPDSVKARLAAASGPASLCVQREDLPPAYVTVEGPVDRQRRRRRTRTHRTAVSRRPHARLPGGDGWHPHRDRAADARALARTTDYAQLPQG